MRILLVLALVSGCKHEQKSALDRTDDYPVPAATGSAPTAVAPVPAPTPTPSPTAPAPSDDLSGTIVTTMDAGGYTYAQLDHGGTKIWVAGPETKLVVGTTLSKMAGQLMTDFRSNTLNRTFDQIYFVAAFPGAGAAAAPVTAAQPTTGADEKVAAAPGGKTVAAVWAAKDALKGKAVIVRGKVVKLNNGIMGKNWVHLRDGSGANGTNDLLVTTQDTVKLGDVVTASGSVATHQDFGAGYSYEVLLENATLAAK